MSCPLLVIVLQTKIYSQSKIFMYIYKIEHGEETEEGYNPHDTCGRGCCWARGDRLCIVLATYRMISDIKNEKLSEILSDERRGGKRVGEKGGRRNTLLPLACTMARSSSLML